MPIGKKPEPIISSKGATFLSEYLKKSPPPWRGTPVYDPLYDPLVSSKTPPPPGYTPAHTWGTTRVSQEEFRFLSDTLGRITTEAMQVIAPMAELTISEQRIKLPAMKASELDVYILRQLTRDNAIPVSHVSYDNYVDGYITGLGFGHLLDHVKPAEPVQPAGKTLLEQLNEALLTSIEEDNGDNVD